MKNFKRFFALLMTTAMVLVMMVPAMAYTITLTHLDQLVEHQYEAYQIFTGDLSNIDGKDILSNIKYGSGVDGITLLADLKSDAENPHYEYFASDEVKDAADIADILSNNHTNTALVDDFLHVVGECLTFPITSPTYNNGVYTWENVDAGYYLIKDKDGSLDDKEETATKYMLQVVDNIQITPKGGKVTHDKIIDDGGHQTEAADYSIGDSVKFILEGTLPENYEHFEDYEYAFVDTLSEGLTYNDDVQVYIENRGVKGDALSSGYTAVLDSNNILKVTFGDLKQIADVHSHSTIIVEYTATLNANAVIGGTGNLNTSYIIFDNDPHGDGKGNTPEDKVYVFTWELDVTKIAGDKKTNPELEGAKFVLYRMGANNKKQYVQLNSEHKVTGWVDEVTDNEIPATATTMTSGSDGIFKIIGLEADTYYLKETEAPLPYNLLKETITVDIAAAVKENTEGTAGVIQTLKITVDNHVSEDGDKGFGIVSMQVINNPGATLPETGGIGTTLFYIIGGVLFAGAVILLVTKKRMASEK